MVEFWVWFYKTEGVWNLIKDTGFAPLPDFIAEMVVSKLVGDVQCVNSDRNFYLAAPELLQTEPVNALVSSPILSSFWLLHDVYSSFIDTQELWTLLPVTSTTALPSISSSTNDALFSIYFPDLSNEVDENKIIAQRGYSTPYILFGLVPVFSMVGVSFNLNMSADVLAKIYMCDILTWDHEMILSQNPILKSLGAAKGKNITLVYHVDQTDSTYILTRFLAMNNEDFNTKIGQGTTFTVMCPNSIIVSSEPLMSAEIRYNDGTLGYLSMSSAISGSLQNISLFIDEGQNAVTSSLSTMHNCLKSASWVHELAAPITHLNLPFAKFCDFGCWPLTIVANIFVPTQYSTAHLGGYRNCSAGVAAGQYIGWLLKAQNTAEALSSNALIPIPSINWKESWLELQNSMVCDGNLLLINIPQCTLQDYQYNVSQCQGMWQGMVVQYSKINGSLCADGLEVPDSLKLECDHILKTSFYGKLLITFPVCGMIIFCAIITFQCFIVKVRNYGQLWMNQILFVAALFTNLSVLCLNLGPTTNQHCSLRPWLWNLPLDIIFSVLYAKVKIGFETFKTKQCKVVAVPWKRVFAWIIQVLVGEILILVVWSCASPPHAEIEYRLATSSGMVFENVAMIICNSKYDEIFKKMLLAYRITWFAVGLYIAFKTLLGTSLAFQLWNMKNESGDSRLIGLGLYNFIFFSLFMIGFVNFSSSSQKYILVQSILACWIANSSQILTVWTPFKAWYKTKLEGTEHKQSHQRIAQLVPMVMNHQSQSSWASTEHIRR